VLQRGLPRPFKTESEDHCIYRSAEALRHPNSRATTIPRCTRPWNPAPAHRTRRGGAPVIYQDVVPTGDARLMGGA